MSNDNKRPPTDGDLADFGPSLKDYLGGNRDALASLPTRDREIVERLAPLLEAARSARRADRPWATIAGDTAPPLSRDPIAAALGLIAGPDDVLAADRFKNARTHARLDIRDVADGLSARGWTVDVAQVFRWQRGDTNLVPALLSAVADILSTSPDSLRPRPTGIKSPRLADLLDDAVIAAFIDDWAQQTSRSIDDVRVEAARTLASLNYRNENSATRQDLLAVLRALRSMDPLWPE